MRKTQVPETMGDIASALHFYKSRHLRAGQHVAAASNRENRARRGLGTLQKPNKLSADELEIVSTSFGRPAAIESRCVLVPEVPKIFKNQWLSETGPSAVNLSMRTYEMGAELGYQSRFVGVTCKLSS